MFKRNFCRVLLLALMSPTIGWTLGLGDIHLKSTLNAPLDADIDVVGASADDLTDLKANLASRDTFTRNGLDYPSFLGTVTFSVAKGGANGTLLHVHSSDVVNEPFATLLIEVNWARGHLVREYTVLLDPPVFSSAAQSNAPVAAPSTGASTRGGSVERPAAAPAAPTSTASAPAASNESSAPVTPASSAPRSSGGSYSVKRGDTLSSIVSQNYPGANRASRERDLVGIYRANTSAFDGNMNSLRAGSTLTLPSDGDLQAISPGDAATEVRKQYAQWNARAGGNTGGGQLRLVPPQEAAAAPANGAAPSTAATAAAEAASANNAKSAALQQQLQQLQGQLAETQRLLQLRNAQLAALQAQATQSTKNAAPPVTAPPAAPPAAPVASAPPAEASAPAASSAPAATAESAPPAEVSSAPVAKPAAAPAPAASESPSLLDWVIEHWLYPAALVAALIVLLVVRAVRSRQEEEFDRSLGRLAEPSFAPTNTGTIRTSETQPVRALAPQRDEQSSYRVEESGSHEQPSFESHEIDREEAGSTSASGRHIAIDDSVTGDAPVALDQGDPLAEADFHMAYGLYDQAAELVQIAITREPNRRDLKLKLLEVFFVWGNKERFLQSARELAATRDQALPGEWEKIVIMGRQIAPDDALFTSGEGLSGAAIGGVDLNLEGGQNRVDFDLLGEPTVSGPGAEGVDLDLGAALGAPEELEPTRTGEAPTLSDTGVDFVLDDPERGNDATGSTREMPEPAGGTEDTARDHILNIADGDAPTIEQPHLQDGENATIRQKIDAATRLGAMASGDQTAELALDDLGLDLGALEGVGDETGDTGLHAGPDAPTMLAGLDEDTRSLLSRAEREQKTPPASPAAPVPAEPSAAPKQPSSTTGTWLFNDTDFASVLGPKTGQDDNSATEMVTQLAPQPDFGQGKQEPEQEFDTNSTSRLMALDADALDLDFGDLGNLAKDEPPSTGLDLDVGTAHAEEGGSFAQTQRIPPEEMSLNDLEPATMSEVGTKLDLARAYMDMGDPEGARSILAEVLSEGSVSQKQEARRLMDTLPG